MRVHSQVLPARIWGYFPVTLCPDGPRMASDPRPEVRVRGNTAVDGSVNSPKVVRVPPYAFRALGCASVEKAKCRWGAREERQRCNDRALWYHALFAARGSAPGDFAQMKEVGRHDHA